MPGQAVNFIPVFPETGDLFARVVVVAEQDAGMLLIRLLCTGSIFAGAISRRGTHAGDRALHGSGAPVHLKSYQLLMARIYSKMFPG